MTVEQEYAKTRAKSRELWERAKASMPSGAAHDGRVFSPFPFYVDHADGARKWDVDGYEYIDCWSGHGALMLGHNHPAIVKAITDQAHRGLHYSACHELEVRWAELIRSCVPGAEKVRFTMTGTETTALAIRVARAHVSSSPSTRSPRSSWSRRPLGPWSRRRIPRSCAGCASSRASAASSSSSTKS